MDDNRSDIDGRVLQTYSCQHRSTKTRTSNLANCDDESKSATRVCIHFLHIFKKPCRSHERRRTNPKQLKYTHPKLHSYLELNTDKGVFVTVALRQQFIHSDSAPVCGYIIIVPSATRRHCMRLQRWR